MRPAIVCGLAAEARIVAGADATIIAGGGDGRRLAETLAALPPDCPSLLSFGVAGGLDPRLHSGDVRVATGVVAEADRIAAHSRWGAQLAAALGVPVAPFAGADNVVADVAAKSALRIETDAALVDMETHVMAREARRRGIPWAAIRAVTDPATRALPNAVAVGMRPDGGIDLRAILVSLMKNPGQLPGLIRAGGDARVAFAALLRCRQVLGPGLARLDL